MTIRILEALLTKYISGSISKEEQEQLSLLLQNLEYDGLFVEWLDGILSQFKQPEVDNVDTEKIWNRIQEKICGI